MAKKGDRMVITFQCTDCRARNYHSSKNRRNDPQRLERRRFCSTCGNHRLHREVR